jgi:TPR repeat protein
MNFFSRIKLKSLRKKIVKSHSLREQRGAADDVKREIAAHLALAKFYDQHIFDKNIAKAEILAFESYRAAAALGDAKAQYICGERLLERAKFWDTWSKGMFGAEAHKKYAKDNYEEAFSFIKTAENNGFPMAKRLHGLAYVNGWGMAKDLDKGFQLVIESIDQEGAWDRATQIFQKLGINSPEFFEALRSRKKTS